jgi:hypothetical protein
LSAKLLNPRIWICRRNIARMLTAV